MSKPDPASSLSAKRFERVDAILLAALERAPPERGKFVAAQCGEDSSLRLEVDSLLEAHESRACILDRPAAELLVGAASAGPAADWIGRRVGEFRIVRVIGAGGMGTIFEALQAQPERTVALKVLRMGIASSSALRRFEYESRILAKLRHPGIAQVFAAGTHVEAGVALPYFAMEYVPGARSIVEHAAAEQFTARDRLQLFANVCDGVQHGHQRGVIHRDLKPANILVDTDGQPKIIDFGVARATDSDVAVTTGHTDLEQLIGTLQYMSPEQFDADLHDLDVRSDVYALGVVLYELLCGQLPYYIGRKSIADAARIVKETSPPRASSIRRELRRDLETIVHKALEKNRERRYQSAADLADDIRRYLHREPIEARPPSATYQLHMFARRNTAAVVATMVIAVTLVAATIVSAVYGARATRAANAAVEQRNQAQQAAAQFRAVNQFMADILEAPDRFDAPQDRSLRDFLDDAAAQLKRKMTDDPLVRAHTLVLIGKGYRGLGEFHRAEMHLREALEIAPDHFSPTEAPITDAKFTLVDVLKRTQRLEEAEALGRELLENLRAAYGERHETVAEALALLGRVLRQRGRLAEAESLTRRALEIRRDLVQTDDVRVAKLLSHLGSVLLAGDRHDEAAASLRECLDILELEAEPDAYEVGIALNNLGNVEYHIGARDQAREHWGRALDILSQYLADDHPTLTITRVNVALGLMEKGEYQRAEPMFRKALAARRIRFGPRSAPVASLVLKLGELCFRDGRMAEADRNFNQALAIYAAALPPTQRDVVMATQAYAIFLLSRRRFADAEPLLRQSIEARHAEREARTPGIAGTMSLLGVVLTRQSKAGEAEPFLREAYEIRREKLPPAAWMTANSASALGECLLALERYDEAEPLLINSYAALRSSLGDSNPRTREAQQRLIRFYEATGRAEQAQALSPARPSQPCAP